MDKMVKKAKRDFAKLHINYKDWNEIALMCKWNGIKTFSELIVFCMVWKIKSYSKLFDTLNKHLTVEVK